MFKDLIDRARKAAREHLPAEVVEAGKRVRSAVVELAPEPIAEAVERLLPAEEVAAAEAAAQASGDAAASDAGAPSPADAVAPDAPDAPDAQATAHAADSGAPAAPGTPDAGPLRESAASVLERVKTKADKGLKPEDRLVVVYATAEQADDVEGIMAILARVDATVRQIDLDRERPQVKRQLAELTGVMVPPYVYINGRYWGSRYELESLAGSGDLTLVVANRLDEISSEAKRIGKVHDSYSDEISVENILQRWKLGHILCVDDLDAWYEVDKHGKESFFCFGGPRDVADMRAVAEEIVENVEAEEYEAIWQLEPSVHLH